MYYLITSTMNNGEETKKIERKETLDEALIGYHKVLSESINVKDEVTCIILDEDGNTLKGKNWKRVIDESRFFSVKITTTTSGSIATSIDSYGTLDEATIRFHDNMQRLIGKSKEVLCLVINSSCGIHENEKWKEESEV